MTTTNNDLEKRTFYVSDLSVEKRDDGNGPAKTEKIVGHAAVFNKIDGPSYFREMIEPGAFSETLGKDDVRALFNHDPNFILGRSKAGTLTLTEDDEGLFMEITPPDTGYAADIATSIERGDISQASFAFRTLDDEVRTINGEEVRVLKKVQLSDVSVVTYPFYEETDVGMRSREKAAAEKARAIKRENMRKRLIIIKHENLTTEV